MFAMASRAVINLCLFQSRQQVGQFAFIKIALVFLKYNAYQNCIMGVTLIDHISIINIIMCRNLDVHRSPKDVH